jgi:hypothetical protein
VDRNQAKDGTARKTAMKELEALESRPSQSSLTVDVPERSWAYRFAKKHFYTDFGAYSKLP